MKKYKVEFNQQETFVVDVLAKNEEQARELAQKKFFDEIRPQNMEHLYQTGDTDIDVGNIYDVTNTDDPFNP